MTDLVTLKTRLTEAEDARHQFGLGTAVVEVWRDGRRVKYSGANVGNLDSYILALRNEIAALEALEAGAPSTRRKAFTAVWL